MLELTSEQRVLLEPCSWETYERIVSEHADRKAPRFTFAVGRLEVMSPSCEHERINEALKQIVYVVCEELGREVEGLGSTTQRDPSLQQGVGPDSSFYFDDPERDPERHPPDLVVEVEITRSSLNKLPLFARLGVPEVWRYRPEQVSIHVLSGGEYREAATSSLLPLSALDLTDLLARRKSGKRTAWLRELRERVRPS